VTGEVGTGKTMLCRKLIDELPDQERAVYIPNPHLMPSMLRVAVARELGLEVDARHDQNQILNRIHARLIEMARRGYRVIVCLDEAQAMPDETLEALRLLTNLETQRRKLLHVVLFGQPELLDKLAKPELRQVRQRIAWSYHLTPYDREDVAAYVAHRLAVAGYRGRRLFSRWAVHVLWRASGGVPRVVNILAHKSLMRGYGRGASRIDARDVRAAAAETDGATRPTLAPLRATVYALGVVVLGLGLWALWVGASA
jgi:MSHA biogenesis protein MshM